MSNKFLPEQEMLLKLDYWLAKQEAAPVRSIERVEAGADPRAESFRVEERAPAETQRLTHPGESGKVQTKIYELVHRGGRTFERARTAWVNPEVAQRLNQRKVATDWIHTLGNYLPIYFVGGYIRDKYFKKVSKDVDIIALTPLANVKQIFDNLGIKYSEHSNAFARLKFHVGDLKIDMISTTADGLLDNLRQRDFTINAIAQSVTGQFYDPYHGLDDIKAKVLRTPADRSLESFTEDSSRILRAARFLSDFPVKPHGSLLAAMPDASELVGNLKPDRIGWELKKILKTEKPWIGLRFLSTYDIIQYICSDLNKLRGLKQKGRRKDVWDHTLRSLKAAKSTDLILNLALLFHDVGKGAIEKVNGNFPGHADPGSKLTEKTLTRLGFNKNTISRVSNLIANHKFLDEMKQDPDVDEIKKLVLELRGDLNRFFELMKADSKGAGDLSEDAKKLETFIRSVKSSLPDEAGEEDETEIQKLDEVPRPERKDGVLLEKSGDPTPSIESKVLNEIDESMFLLSEDYPVAAEVEDLIKLVGKK